MSDRSDGSLRESPPLTPAEEEIADLGGDLTFIDTCQEILKKFPEYKTWIITASLLTQSPKWGAVWRVDYDAPGEILPGYVNRIVCWRALSGVLEINFAVAQRIPPLRFQAQ
jgi:hypothetical protein